ncbi:MAG: hypothetical protein AAF242_06040, partial [Bacteroidota bacterium]
MDWRYNTIWYHQIAADQQVHWDLKKDKIDPAIFKKVAYATINHLKFKEQSFDLLPESDRLRHLELTWANLKELKGLQKFPKLKRLNLEYCIKLHSFSGIEQLKDSLEFLFINQSKKLKIQEELLQLNGLKVLCLNACGDIENLDFLKYFPDLVDFRFVDTKV